MCVCVCNCRYNIEFEFPALRKSKQKQRALAANRCLSRHYHKRWCCCARATSGIARWAAERSTTIGRPTKQPATSDHRPYSIIRLQLAKLTLAAVVYVGTGTVLVWWCAATTETKVTKSRNSCQFSTTDQFVVRSFAL